MKLFIYLFFVSLFFPVKAFPQFWDQGFLKGEVQSSYPTLSSTITTLPCIFPATCPIPEGTTLTFDQNLRHRRVASPSQSLYWVLDHNNEPAFYPCNIGPPDQSLPIVHPRSGIMGFNVIREGGILKAHLSLDTSFTNPCEDFAPIPYLAIGADREAGNGGANIGYLNGPYNRTSFVVKVLEQHRGQPFPYAPTMPVVTVFAAWAEAEWDGENHQLQVELFRDGHVNYNGLRNTWNWPVPNHYLAPGKIVGYLVKEPNIPMYQDVPLTLNWTDLFREASSLGIYNTPLPNYPVPLRGVHFHLEVSGKNTLISVLLHGIKQLR